MLRVSNIVKSDSRVNFTKILENNSSEIGIIIFLGLPPRKDRRFIIHKNWHAVCCVVKGRGSIQIANHEYWLEPEAICWIPPNTTSPAKVRKLDWSLCIP